jgi:hypothetical protein
MLHTNEFMYPARSSVEYFAVVGSIYSIVVFRELGVVDMYVIFIVFWHDLLSLLSTFIISDK